MEGLSTGDLTGWITNDPVNNIIMTAGPVNYGTDCRSVECAHSGNFGLNFGTCGGNISYLAQAQLLPTVAGTYYTVSFWIDFNGGLNEASLSWDGTTIIDLIDAPANGWQQYVFTEYAATDATSFSFGLSQYSGYSGLDDISVTGASSATPLPATLPLFATGLGALGLLGWRRKRKKAAIAAA